MITVGDVLSLASIYTIGKKLGASIDEIKQLLPAITQQAIALDSELAKLQTRPQFYEKLEIDLSVSRDNERYDVSGDFVQAIDVSQEASLYVKFNEIDNVPVDVCILRRIETPFDCLYLSNEAQEGKRLTLVVGKGQSFQISQVSPMEINIVAQTVALDMNITSSDVMVPMDIQGSYVMVPIDIQGQYITLDVNVTNSQVNVNITNSVVSVKITDVAQVDITAQSVAIKGLADWATEAGKSINPYNIVASPGIAPNNWGYAEEYYDNFLVPSGKKWLIYGMSVRCYRYSDGKTPVPFSFILEIPGAVPMLTGTVPEGDSFNSWFSRPFLATAGQRARINILNLDSSYNLGATVILNAVELDVS